ncbi:L,D-transpeptidase catalytic domain protein [Mycobacterium xenopi 4042]|uniref:L,D-transpeptidase catalytic domain protein n=1 Tax=Mycobacterium xenopi 4042 TaxID=1299334 RepID=X8BLK2_MYCXE|nr:L,D-transpeptidase catalytic domain protein [Mycobacterium xenopi 4042]
MAKPIIINFQRPIADQAMAEKAIHISSEPPVPGKFYWMSPTQVRWRPLSFWPAHTIVNIDAAGTKSSFQTGDALVATADDATHTMTVTRNGKVEKTIPMSMGMSAGGHQTPNGTYYVLDKKATVVMDSSTYGVPVNSTYGYKVTVQDAVQFDNSGDFVHSAPWSVADQGVRDVSHGCINISPPTPSGSSTTSVAAIPSWSRTPAVVPTARTTAPTTGRFNRRADAESPFWQRIWAILRLVALLSSRCARGAADPDRAGRRV